MSTTRLTAAQAIVRYLVAQRTITTDGREASLFPGVLAIFGHGNVTGLGNALDEMRDALPTIRAQNEQGMGLACSGFARAARRRQIMVATSSIGPGALNLVTAAGVAHANRLPALFLCGDTFASRIPDPVLQQIEHFGVPSTTANDAFRAVTRFWDRITRPEQVIQSLPLAIDTLLDPADCGPALIALPQDVQVEAYDYPDRFFEPHVHEVRRPRPDSRELTAAAELLRAARRPLIVAGGGVHYALAESELARFAEAHGIPVVETVAGKSSLPADHAAYVGPLGVLGREEANRLADEADVVLAVGTRLQDFTTGSWTVFGAETRIIGLNVARFDAAKHRSSPLVADAAVALELLSAALGDWRADDAWASRAHRERDAFRAFVAHNVLAGGELTYAQVVGAVNRLATPSDYALTAAGGFPGELNVNWQAHASGSFDCEYGFSCMGYEIAGAWGARLARPAGEVFSFVGDGSYLMLNSELLSTVIGGQKLIVLLCDNGGFAVIERLQVGQGGAPFNNMLPAEIEVDWVAHARALGCEAERVETIAGLEAAVERARAADRTTVISMRIAPQRWTEGGAFWEVGVPEVAEREGVLAARTRLLEGKRRQRVGW